MSVIVDGVVFYYVDTICLDEVIYDVYEDDNDNHFYQVIDTTY